jgi:hypothetical protein
MMENLANDTTLPIEFVKRHTMAEVGCGLLGLGYEPAFVAGMLANIRAEGDAGRFESSSYTSKPEEKPHYLVYVDTHHYYNSEYSGQRIIGKNLSTVRSLLEHLRDLDRDRPPPSPTPRERRHWRGGFGLGCLQWTWYRTLYLMDIYQEAARGNISINLNQVIQAEIMMIDRELKRPPRQHVADYRPVYRNWQAANSRNINSADAAYDAGRRLSLNYIIPPQPGDGLKAEERRGNSARTIYNVMMR